MQEPLDSIECSLQSVHRLLRATCRLFCGIILWAGFLLSGFGLKSAETAEQAAQAVLPADSGSQPSGAIPELRGRPAPALPPAQPSPPPPPSVTAPPSPAPPPEAAPSLREGPKFVLRDVNIVGNTVLDAASIHDVVAPYIGKLVTNADLEEIRRQLTLLYINRGYINSGAIIPDQNVINGVVSFRFVEGRVTDIEVTDGLQPGDEIVVGSYKALRTLKPEASVKVDNSAPKKTEDEQS